MPELNPIAMLFLGALIGGIIGHWLAKTRDSANRLHAAASAKEGRLRDFRAAISTIRDTVIAASDHELVGAFGTSLQPFREACAKIEADLSDVASFHRKRDAYLQLKKAEIECRDRDAKRPSMIDVFGNYNPALVSWVPPPRYELGRNRIKELLDDLMDLTKGQT
jgi:hypothetical protein